MHELCYGILSFIYLYMYVYMRDISQYQRGSHHGFISHQVAAELPAGWSQVPAQISATLTHWHTNTHSGQVP